ncbi:MAG: hypothetical protein R2827_10290 [Bdellovibrionales bacterium]
MSVNIDYNLLSHDRTNMLAQQFEQRLSARGTGGGPDTLRHAVLTSVIRGNYKRATEEVENYGKSKEKDFRFYQSVTEIY